MITYTVADKWLRDGGTLAFVITQSVFQNPSSAGFRNFRINAKDRLRPVQVDDLKAMKPFTDAANKTSVAVFKKGRRFPKYPVPYRVWGPAAGAKRTINPHDDLRTVQSKVSVAAMEACEVGGEGSPWAILPPGRMEALRGLAGTSSWVEGRKGISTDLNGVYLLPVVAENGDPAAPLVQVKTRPEAGRTKIGNAKRVWIEPAMLYPLIKGAADFDACYFDPKSELFALVPNSGIRRADYEAAEQALGASLPRTKAYLTSFKSQMEARSTYRTRMKSAPFYAVYNVGSFTFKPWKVVWAEMSSTFKAAVVGLGDVPLVGKRPYVPDHKVYYVALDDRTTAHYLCGLLNAPMVTEYIDSHNVSIQVSDIFKHLQLPPFSINDATHTALAKLVENAHKEHDADKRAALVDGVRIAGEAVLTAWIHTAPPKP